MNWGWGIAIFFSCFVVFMVGLVVRSHGIEVNLVAEDYYAQELNFQQEIDKSNAFREQGGRLNCKPEKEGVVVKLKGNFDYEKVDGTLFFIRNSDEKLDKEFPIKLDAEGKQILPKEAFKTGYYRLKIVFKDQGADYQWKKEVYL